MKRLWILAILMMTLAGCGRSAAPGGGQCKEGLCVKIEVTEPIRCEEPIGVTVTVTSEQDISNLQISLTSFPPVSIEGPQGKWVEGGIRLEDINLVANQPLVVVYKVRCPSDGSDEILDLQAGAYTPNLSYVTDSVSIYLSREGGVVNPTSAVLSGTPALIGTMPPERLLTPSPTPRPTFTPFPTLPPPPTHSPFFLGTPTAYPLFSPPTSVPTAYP